jgi:RNase P/RNase MRP subunit POP5
MVGTKHNKNVSNVKASVQNKSSKQKILPPTLREKQRYVVYKIIFEDKIITGKSLDFNAVNNNILSQCNATLGIFDGGKAGLISAKYNPEKMSGVVKVNNAYVDKLKVCFGLIKNISIPNIADKKVIVDCIYVSGMLNKAVDKMDS